MLHPVVLLAFVFAAAENSGSVESRPLPCPTAIVTQAVPPISIEAVQRLRQYANVRSAGFLDWAPDGKGILIGTRFGNTTQIHRVYQPGGRREQVTFFDEPASGRFLPHDVNRIVYFMSDGGDENNQIYILDRQTGNSTCLTDGKSRNLLGPIRGDGSALAVHSNLRNGKDTDLYIAEPQAGDFKMAMETDGEFWTATDWSQDGRYLLLSRYVSATESYPAILDLAEKSRRMLPTQGAAPAAYTQLRFSPDARFAYLATDARGEFRELAKLNLGEGTYEWLSADIPWDVDEIEVEPNSGRVAFTTNEAGYSRLYLMDPKGRQLKEVPAGLIANLRFSPGGGSLGFSLARPDTPPDAYSLDLQSDVLTRWTYSEAGGLNPELFISPSLVEVPTFDGRKYSAFYYRPKLASSTAPAAVLISIHGGPESQFRPRFSGFFQYCLNELGIAVVAPNVRGSAGYGKTFLKLDNGPLREDSVKDIGALLDWIADQPELDGSRVAVMGGSYGGYMVLASLVHFSDRIRAGVDIVGIANFITFLERTSPYRRDLRRAEYGDEREPQMRAVFERINPSSRADQIRSALLVAHGRNDPRVPFFEAEQIARRVAEAGKEVWTVYADNEGHGFAKQDNREYLDAVIATFLREKLAP